MKSTKLSVKSQSSHDREKKRTRGRPHLLYTCAIPSYLLNSDGMKEEEKEMEEEEGEEEEEDSCDVDEGLAKKTKDCFRREKNVSERM